MQSKSSVLIAFCIRLILMTGCNAYRILGIFVFPVRSHQFLGSSLLRGLAEAGHDITMISTSAQKSLPKNGTWKEIVLKDISTAYERNSNLMNLSKLSTSQQWIQYMQLFKYITETTLNSADVQNLIHSHEKFDAVIVSDLYTDSMKAFAAHFDAHLIIFSNFGGYNFCYNDINVPSLPSHFPELGLNRFQGKLSYFDRIRNIWEWAVRNALNSYYMFPHQENLVKKQFPNLPDLKVITLNTSLVLVNSHPSINYQQPKISMMIDIGGFHLKPPKKLPENLQTILDDAKNGVIYFSMGSNMKPEHLPKNVIEAFLKVFGKRKEIVLWKCSESLLSGKPDNVIVGDWFPQQDILAHPALKIFITQAGFLSLTETIYNGVPTIAIPVALDQIHNAVFLADNELGLTMDLEYLSEEIISYSIQEVISNPKYKRAAKERSLILKDRIKPPMEEAIYWVEYVIRHNGAKHLKVPYFGLPWYQFYLLDIILPLSIGFITCIWLMKNLIFTCFGAFKNKKLKTL